MSRRASLPGAAELFRTTGGTQPSDVLPAPQPKNTGQPTSTARQRASSGRERHEEKITVYCSAQELLELESARLRMRAEHGVAVDRGRIVREAIALALADLDAHGAGAALLQRLQES
jgi:hypothetical protein